MIGPQLQAAKLQAAQLKTRAVFRLNHPGDRHIVSRCIYTRHEKGYTED